MEIKCARPLPEKFEKTLILNAEEDDDDDVYTSSDDEVYDYVICREKAKQIVKDFLQQVQDNRFSEFPWPPDPDCPVYKYKYLRSCIRDLGPKEEKCETIKKFVDQVRKSWGYDVDCIPPRWFDTQVGLMYMKEQGAHIILRQATDCAIDRINAEAEKVGKTFELVRVNKVVVAGRALYLMTLTIKNIESDAHMTVRATVTNPPPFLHPELEELKLIPLIPT